MTINQAKKIAACVANIEESLVKTFGLSVLNARFMILDCEDEILSMIEIDAPAGYIAQTILEVNQDLEE